MTDERRDPRWLIAVVIAGALLWTAIGFGVNALVNGDECIQIEAQDWWKPTGDTEFRHVHMGGCMPRPESTVSGTVHIDFTLQLHNNIGTRLNSLKIHVNKSLNADSESPLNFTCDTEQCSRVVGMDLDTTKFPDGRQVVRFVVAGVDPDGLAVRASLKYAVIFDNGKANQNGQSWGTNDIDANGWYTGTGYARAQITTPIPATVTSPWTPGVNISVFNDTAVSPDTIAAPVDRSYVSVDPSFHAVPPFGGTVMRDSAGRYVGTVTVTADPGAHRLFIRSLQKPIAKGTHAGILVVPFTVGE